MCDPVSLVSLAIGAASQVTGFMAASQEAETQNQLAENNRIEANKSAADQYADIQLRMQQEEAAASQQVQDGQREAAKARGNAKVVAAENGVTGLSIDSILAEYEREQGRFERTTEQNLKMTQEGLRSNQRQVKTQAADRINSVQKAAKPSFLPYAIGIGSGALDLYSASKKNVQ